MPVGYLITVTIMAMATACAVAPPSHPPLLRRAALIPAMVVNEVPLPAILFLAAATGLAFAEGNIDSAAAWVCVATAAATGAGLVYLARRATLARPNLEQALVRGFGEDGAAVTDLPSPRRSKLLAFTSAVGSSRPGETNGRWN